MYLFQLVFLFSLDRYPTDPNWTTLSYHAQKINLRLIQDINVRPETIILTGKMNAVHSLTSGLSSIFWDVSPQSRETKEKNKQIKLH